MQLRSSLRRLTNTLRSPASQNPRCFFFCWTGPASRKMMSSRTRRKLMPPDGNRIKLLPALLSTGAIRHETFLQSGNTFCHLSLCSSVPSVRGFGATTTSPRHWAEVHHASRITRGWCRVAMLCKMMLGNQDMPIVVVTAPDVAQYARTVNWVDCLPQEAEFSYQSDRATVIGIFEQAVSSKLNGLELRLEGGNIDLYRYFLARRDIMIARPATRATKGFWEYFRYEWLKSGSGFGPVIPAILAGDVELVKTLLAARCPLDRPRVEGMPEVLLAPGLTAMHLAALQVHKCFQASRRLEGILIFRSRECPFWHVAALPEMFRSWWITRQM